MKTYLLVLPWPTSTERRTGKPLSGQSGKDFTAMLAEAGIQESDCQILYARSEPVPYFDAERLYSKGLPLPETQTEIDNLHARIAALPSPPRVLIPCGEVPLRYLTGKVSVSSWRGSMLEQPDGSWIIPTFAPFQIQRMWAWRALAVTDLRRAYRQAGLHPIPTPNYLFHTEPSADFTVGLLSGFLSRLNDGEVIPLGVDIETRAQHIDCIGIAWSTREAICIPFFTMTSPDKSYFSLEEELSIVLLLRSILTHQNAHIIYQNGLYENQYFARYWGFVSIPEMDTMFAGAVAYPGLSKSLDSLSSLYLDYHQFWKAERKEATDKQDDLQRWIYNCKDCVVTLDLYAVLRETLRTLSLVPQFEFEMKMFEPVLYTMLKGVRINKKRRDELALEIPEIQLTYQHWFDSISAWDDVVLVKSKTASPWYDSPTQQTKIFYGLLAQKKIYNKKPRKNGSRGLTVDDEALKLISIREPILSPLCEKLLEYRSLSVFYSTFVMMPLDHDGYMRCYYNPVGTETFRLNSSADAFGFGGNLQNLPTGNED